MVTEHYNNATTLECTFTKSSNVLAWKTKHAVISAGTYVNTALQPRGKITKGATQLFDTSCKRIFNDVTIMKLQSAVHLFCARTAVMAFAA